MKKVNINYNETFGTTHSRDYYRGKSFHYSGKWVSGAHYLSDDYNIDFVVHGEALLACAKSHLSTLENEPTDFIYSDSGNIIGVASAYWDFVLSGIRGKSAGIRVNPVTHEIEICKNTNVPEEQQIWEGTEIIIPAVVEEYGDDHVLTLSQDFLTKELYKKADASEVADTYMPKSGGIFIGDITFNKNATFKKDIDLNNNRIVNLAAPVNDNDAVNKKFIADLPSYNISQTDINIWNNASIWIE